MRSIVMFKMFFCGILFIFGGLVWNINLYVSRIIGFTSIVFKI